MSREVFTVMAHVNRACRVLIALSVALGLTFSSAHGQPQLTRLPDAPPRLPQISPPELSEEATVVPLPEAPAQCSLAGGGRYLLLHLPDLHKVAVFDVNQAAVVSYIPVPSRNVLIAGSAESLFVLDRESNKLYAWDLSTEKMTHSTSVPENIRHMTIGYASAGPLVLDASVVLEARLLRQVKMQLDKASSSGGGYYKVAASGDGSLIVAGRGNVADTVTVERGQVTFHGGAARDAQWISHDGRYLSDGGSIYESDVPWAPVASLGSPVMNRVTCVDTNYFVRREEPPRAAPVFAVYHALDLRPLVQIAIPKTPQPAAVRVIKAGADAQSNRYIPPQYEYILIPQAKLFIHNPRNSPAIVLCRMDLEAAINSATQPYCYMTTILPVLEKGQLLSARMRMTSNITNMTFKLKHGPEGMLITPEGQINWRVPADKFVVQTLPVTVEITGDNKARLTYTLMLRVRPQEP